MTTEIIPKKDSPFTFMFNNEAYAVDLYDELTGIRYKPEEITSVRLEKSLLRGRLYNDVAFLTSDNKLLVLIEHQASLNFNMLFRLLEYYVALVSRYIRKTHQNKFGTKKLAFPKAQLFVVYNGKGTMPELPELDLGDVKVKAQVHNIHFNRLKKREDRTSATAAYALFVELMDTGYELNEALDEVVNRGYLTEFFGRKEFRDMFAELFSYDNELLEAGEQKGFEKGIAKGIEQGIEKGQSIQRETFKLLKAGIPAEKIKEELQITDEELAHYQAAFNEIFNS